MSPNALPHPTLDSDAHEIRHLDQRDLARRWRISERTLERWRWLGIGPDWIKIGGRVVYPLSAVEAFEAKQTRQGGSLR